MVPSLISSSYVLPVRLSVMLSESRCDMMIFVFR